MNISTVVIRKRGVQTDTRPQGTTKDNTAEDRTEARATRTDNKSQETPGEVRDLLTKDPTGNHERGHPGLGMNDLLLDILTVVTKVTATNRIEGGTEDKTGHPGKTNQEIPEEARDLMATDLDGNRATGLPNQAMNDLLPDILTVVTKVTVTNRIEEGTEDKTGHHATTNQETPGETRALATDPGGSLTREHPYLAMNDFLLDTLTVGIRIAEGTEDKTGHPATTNQEIPEEVRDLLATNLAGNHVIDPPELAMSDLLPDIPTVVARPPVADRITVVDRITVIAQITVADRTEEETEAPTGHISATNREIPEETHDLLPTSLSGNHVKKHPGHLIADPHLRVLITFDPRKKHQKLRPCHSLGNEAKRNMEAKNTF